MANLAQIWDWFMTGKRPTQAQFWESWASSWNKNEVIPQSAISNLPNTLNAKAEKAQFDAHKTAADAHQALFDLKQSLTDKGAQGGYAPLDEFTKLAAEYLNIVDDLVTGGSDALLSAEQGKVLQGKIDAINLILTSDDVNFDTIQELVNAIKEVETWLETILVNDLTTGGTTKALTAEMGKQLDLLKVDKVAGERLINAAEITKLAGLGNVVTTVKTIVSTALATQNVAGFVTYINALNPVLVVGANETVTYKTSDTGRVFELLLRGRSFGSGQAAITAADVIEQTEWMSKDVTLSNYPNTRNDGANPTNKILGTDATGKLKSYSMAAFPAPYLSYIIPDNQLPSTTFNIYLHGSYFTPTMTVAIAGQTVNSVTFQSENLVLLNITTGAAEGLFSITLNNGTSAVFANALLVILGTVYTPTSANIIPLTGAVTVDADSVIRTTGSGVVSTFELDYLIPAGQDFRVTFNLNRNPLYINSTNNGNADYIDLQTTGSTSMYRGGISIYTLTANNIGFYQASTGMGFGLTNRQGYFDNIIGSNSYFERIGTTIKVYVNNNLRFTYADASAEDLKIKIGLKNLDFKVKYIELA